MNRHAQADGVEETAAQGPVDAPSESVTSTASDRPAPSGGPSRDWGMYTISNLAELFRRHSDITSKVEFKDASMAKGDSLIGYSGIACWKNKPYWDFGAKVEFKDASMAKGD